MKEGKEDMPLVGKTMAEGHTHRMAVLCEKLGSTLREILDGTCPQPAKPVPKALLDGVKAGEGTEAPGFGKVSGNLSHSP